MANNNAVRPSKRHHTCRDENHGLPFGTQLGVLIHQAQLFPFGWCQGAIIRAANTNSSRQVSSNEKALPIQQWANARGRQMHHSPRSV